ncbi:hypothetical protein [Synechococcus phage S-B68]|nr:hypothetical protein [Synechococcus phage S-B68]
MADSNNNGILDSHEKWFLLMRVVVLLWSIGFLTASYLGYGKVDRTFLATTFTAAAASFGVKRVTK